ncbi:putative metallohydrolase (TIGR04338 family) [Nakamurella flavida]|uniref:TIGR04338 family metallohydrolase n=1 Tax=Nakamurella flavida TaxID=363630 RepID=UPI00277E9CA4|nr:TIGR04338 family metallohydrolase [Nakamurella flavida]MDP9778458.1 putative metallohydrolase (TIGR04338 family) [Nakamurella flavida]
MNAARDTQRSRVYEAEQLVRTMFDRAADGAPAVQIAGSTLTLPVERRFASLESVRTYLSAVQALGWVRETWPRATVPVSVRERAGAQRAHYERAGAVIALPTHRGNRAWALRELVLLHELAHHLAPADDEEAHGPAFVDRMLTLVDGVVGPEAALVLRITYVENGVRSAP